MHLTRVVIAAGVATTMTIGLALAGDPVSSDQILQALTPKRLTRSLTATPEDQAKTAAETQFVQSIKNRTTRSLSPPERDQIYAIAQQKPAIDLEITFDYNSAKISNSALPQVDALGKALTDPIDERHDVRGRRSYRRGRQRPLQSGSLGAPRRLGQAIPHEQIRHGHS